MTSTTPQNTVWFGTESLERSRSKRTHTESFGAACVVALLRGATDTTTFLRLCVDLWTTSLAHQNGSQL